MGSIYTVPQPLPEVIPELRVRSNLVALLGVTPTKIINNIIKTGLALASFVYQFLELFLPITDIGSGERRGWKSSLGKCLFDDSFLKGVELSHQRSEVEDLIQEHRPRDEGVQL